MLYAPVAEEDAVTGEMTERINVRTDMRSKSDGVGRRCGSLAVNDVSMLLLRL